MNHEPICAALLARFKQKLNTKIKTFTRQFATFDQLPADAQPALLQVLMRALGQSTNGEPTKWTLYFGVTLLARTGTEDKDKTAETELNELIAGVAAALRRQDDEPPMKEPEHTTLGGLVEYAFINGAVEYVPGEAGEQSFAIVPIEVYVVK